MTENLHGHTHIICADSINKHRVRTGVVHTAAPLSAWRTRLPISSRRSSTIVDSLTEAGHGNTKAQDLHFTRHSTDQEYGLVAMCAQLHERLSYTPSQLAFKQTRQKSRAGVRVSLQSSTSFWKQNKKSTG